MGYGIFTVSNPLERKKIYVGNESGSMSLGMSQVRGSTGVGTGGGVTAFSDCDFSVYLTVDNWRA